MPLSIIVPAYNAAGTLADCLAALTAQHGLPAETEIILVDDGSTDATAAVAESFAVRVVRQPHRGAAAARNAGVAAARGEVILFTDADCRPSPGWATALMAPFSAPAVAGAQGRLASDQPELVARLVQAEYEEKEGRMARRDRVTFIDTASAAYRANVLRASGGFREDLGAVEDTELAFRLAAAGQLLVMAPDAVVYHQHPDTVTAYARRKWRFGQWGAVAYGLYPQRVVDDTRTPGTMRLQLALAPLLILALLPALAGISPWWPAALLLAAFWSTVLPFALRVARRDPAVALAAGPLFLVRALCVGTGVAFGLVQLVLRGTRGLPRPG